MKTRMLWLLLTLTFFLATEAVADSYRCGRKLVRSGDSISDLLRICGEPLYKGRGKETIKIDGVPRKAGVQRWYYRKNQRSLERIILIYEGKIAAIEMGGR